MNLKVRWNDGINPTDWGLELPMKQAYELCKKLAKRQIPKIEVIEPKTGKKHMGHENSDLPKVPLENEILVIYPGDQIISIPYVGHLHYTMLDHGDIFYMVDTFNRLLRVDKPQGPIHEGHNIH